MMKLSMQDWMALRGGQITRDEALQRGRPGSPQARDAAMREERRQRHAEMMTLHEAFKTKPTIVLGEMTNGAMAEIIYLALTIRYGEAARENAKTHKIGKLINFRFPDGAEALPPFGATAQTRDRWDEFAAAFGAGRAIGEVVEPKIEQEKSIGRKSVFERVLLRRPVNKQAAMVTSPGPK